MKELLSDKLREPFFTTVAGNFLCSGVRADAILCSGVIREDCGKKKKLRGRVEGKGIFFISSFLVPFPFELSRCYCTKGPACITSWYPKFNGSHFGLPALSAE